MARKTSRMAGGKLPGCKERGEWAELYSMMMAAGFGMKVSKPFGDSAKYDVGVESQGRVLRVQVKSATFSNREDSYGLSVKGSNRKKYAPGTVDFFAAFLIPIDLWYIIPFEVVGMKNSSLYFTPDCKRHKYREYREAWHLLRGPTGITIQACCGEGDESESCEGNQDSSLRSE